MEEDNEFRRVLFKRKLLRTLEMPHASRIAILVSPSDLADIGLKVKSIKRGAVARELIRSYNQPVDELMKDLDPFEVFPPIMS